LGESGVIGLDHVREAVPSIPVFEVKVGVSSGSRELPILCR
jgi:hypothetical protein